ncbi:MAG TPA: M48 family metalloprotease [Candidatus Bathyarchaeia archaeon]|nr:M48 family metalloprotease [Candidatus Bathyarchaeia archaeon]
MLVTSLFSWSFLGTSLALCSILLNQYQTRPDLTVAEVFGGSVLASLAFSGVITRIARRHAFVKMLRRMTVGPTPFTRFSKISLSYDALCQRMGISNVSLREATRGSAFSISLRGRGVVAISPEMANKLSSEEAEAVLAHELSHIKNGDSTAKAAARLARMAFPFDPVLRLVEAAVHRERELWADRVSSEFTKNPLALASALIKANSRGYGVTGHAMGLLGGTGRGLLCPYPNLERRVDALVQLARRMDFITIVKTPGPTFFFRRVA